jgi:hypothetical protein
MIAYAEFDGGMKAFRDFIARVPETNAKAARMAINQVAQRGGIAMAREHILDQIAFPKEYLKGDRLAVTQLATDRNLEAVITGRKRATSLARFAQGQPIGRRNGGGVTVRVKAGNSAFIKNAWLVKLNAGKSITEDNYNVGLALRVKDGKVLGKKSRVHWLVKDAIALLYAPSVDQVFRDVADDIRLPVIDLVAAEFNRQFVRLNKL